jgi:hypothetical protein
MKAKKKLKIPNRMKKNQNKIFHNHHSILMKRSCLDITKSSMDLRKFGKTITPDSKKRRSLSLLKEELLKRNRD